MKNKKYSAFHAVKGEKIKTKIGYEMKKKYGFNQKRCNEVIYTKTYTKNFGLGKAFRVSVVLKRGRMFS